MRPPVPKLWTLLVHEWLGLRTDLTHTWWHALGKSADPGPQALMQAILVAGAQPYPRQQANGTRQALLTSMAPDMLVEGLETLVEQGFMLRRECNMIEAMILDKLDAAGVWRP